MAISRPFRSPWAYCWSRSRVQHVTFILFLITAILWIVRFASIPLTRSEVWSSKAEHPIRYLHDHYSLKQNLTLQGQSQTVAQAEQEYRRRYNRNPPAGFDKWFAYARERDSPLIDNFDSIHESLAPLWKYSGLEIIHMIRSTLAAEDSHIVPLLISDGKWGGFDHWMAMDIRNAVGHATAKDLPDVVIVLNVLDEPRVVPAEGTLPSRAVIFQDASRRPTDNLLRSRCQSHETGSISDLRPLPLPLVSDPVQTKDVCAHPEYKHQHGFLVAPSTLRYTSSPAPIFSQAKLSLFTDILMPSPFYMGQVPATAYHEDNDPDWSDKANRLTWRGSTTGMYAFGTDDALGRNWHMGHRQRFVDWASRAGNTSVSYLDRGRFGWKIREGVVPELMEMADVKFTTVTQCEKGGCKEQNETYVLGEREPMEVAYQSKFVFDLDGNSFSGRFYTLLESKSVVLKQTLFKEWHDERLIPWVHYVPVSMGMEELPEILRYLGTTEEGQLIAKRIASESREWRRRALRWEDLAIYWYRLILEYGRLMNPNRLAGAYDEI